MKHSSEVPCRDTAAVRQKVSPFVNHHYLAQVNVLIQKINVSSKEGKSVTRCSLVCACRPSQSCFLSCF